MSGSETSIVPAGDYPKQGEAVFAKLARHGAAGTLNPSTFASR
jgi:hypothetical protein